MDRWSDRCFILFGRLTSPPHLPRQLGKLLSVWDGTGWRVWCEICLLVTVWKQTDRKYGVPGRRMCLFLGMWTGNVRLPSVSEPE